jgi:acetylornithine deacetylase/succinyl-diaminopimelate desuccinylase-like protein
MLPAGIAIAGEATGGHSVVVDAATGEVVELLQQLIRNACVNDGTPESGGEVRSVDILEGYLEGSGMDLQRYEPIAGRASLVGRMEGIDPDAPSLVLMGHTDVVPVNRANWRHDPFGGEIVDGEVWGRGAIDMLNLTASMAVAAKRFAESGVRPRGTMIYLAVADEEALGAHGAKWLVDNEPDAVRADYVVTESGGYRLPLASVSGPKLPVIVAEKGTYWCRLRVRGTSGHGSMPFRTDNAVVKAAEVIRRIAEFRPDTDVPEVWRRFVDAAGLPPDIADALRDPAKVESFAESAPDIGIARTVHASTHTTFAPTIVHGGVKTNVIPDTVDLEVDIRTLPGQTGSDIEAMLAEALGDLANQVEVTPISGDEASASSIDTPLWDSLSRISEKLVPGASTVPFLTVGATDARVFRKVGAVAYGYGLFSERIPFAEFESMFHGDNERVDVESLDLTTKLWSGLLADFLA